VVEKAGVADKDIDTQIFETLRGVMRADVGPQFTHTFHYLGKVDCH